MQVANNKYFHVDASHSELCCMSQQMSESPSAVWCSMWFYLARCALTLTSAALAMAVASLHCVGRAGASLIPSD